LPDATPPDWLRVGADFVTIEVAARPGAQRRGVLGISPRGIVIGLASPPEKGKANEELIALVAEFVGVARRDVSILRGTGSRNKTIRIATADARSVANRLIATAKEK